MKPVFFASFLALAGIGWCQTPTQDFSKGFELLVGLGMPPLDSQAIWAKVGDPDMMDYNLREYTRSLKGNGWLIPGKDGTSRQLPLGSLTEMELPKKGKEPQPQDLEKDVNTVIDALNKAVAKKDPDEMYPFYRYSSVDPFLLFAAQLHQTGRKDLANRLAQAAFAFFPTRETAVDAVVDRIAEQFHQKSVGAFFASGDWSTYHRELTALTERYPRGWKNEGAVRLMLPQIARQAKGEMAPEPALPGVALDPKAVAILRELMEPPKRDAKEEAPSGGMSDEDNMRQQMHMMRSMGGSGYAYTRGYGGSGFYQNLWLISDEKQQSNDAQSRLAALRMAAIPALAAAANDPFFTYLPNSRSGGSSYSSRESADERIFRAYQSMNRPATRGEIATQMLGLTLPDPENELREADAETIRSMAMDFWTAHRNATTEELAAVFLKEGSPQQSTQAVSILAKSKNPDAHKLFEAHVLAADSAISLFESVRTYLKERKAEGKSFCDEYAKLVRKQTATMGDEERDEYSWMIKEAGGVEKILKQLQSVAEGESPRAMAIRIGKEEDAKTAPASINGLVEAMSGEEPKKQLLALLSGAYAASKDESVRAQFLTAIFQIDWDTQAVDPQDEEDEEGEEGEENDKPATRVISEAEANVWRRLIADSRPLKSSQGRYFSDGAQQSTISTLACAALESSVVGYEFYALMQAIPIMARPVDEVLTERAKARLDGKPVPPLPNEENVPPERLAALISEAGEKPAADLHAHLLTLTMDERAAWAAWLAEPGEIPVPDNVKQLRHQIVKLSEAGEFTSETMPNFDAIPVGFQVTEKSIETTVQNLASQAGKYSRAMITLGSTDYGPGMEVAASILPFPERKAEEDEEIFYQESENITADMMFSNAMTFLEKDDKPDAVIFVQLAGRRDMESTWSVKDGKATPVADDGEESGKNDLFATSLKSALEAEDARELRLRIGILTRADADKLNTKNE